MSAGLKGDVSSLKKFASALRSLPTVLAHKVAAAAAPALTAVARASFAAGEDSYGNTWAPGEDGKRVTLKKKGGIEKGVYYRSIGTQLRAKLAVAHAKYQLGKRPIFPRQGDKLPTEYVDTLKKTTGDTIRDHLGTR